MPGERRTGWRYKDVVAYWALALTLTSIVSDCHESIDVRMGSQTFICMNNVFAQGAPPTVRMCTFEGTPSCPFGQQFINGTVTATSSTLDLPASCIQTIEILPRVSNAQISYCVANPQTIGIEMQSDGASCASCNLVNQDGGFAQSLSCQSPSNPQFCDASVQVTPLVQVLSSGEILVRACVTLS